MQSPYLNFIYDLVNRFSSLQQQWRMNALALGGSSGSHGGSGGPPGGFLGVLPQTQVAGDTTESTLFTSGSPANLLDNLNDIRYWELPSKNFQIAQTDPLSAVYSVSSGSWHYASGYDPLRFTGANTPSISAPVSGIRYDLLNINQSGVLSWTQGTPTAPPSPPAVTSGFMPLWVIVAQSSGSAAKFYNDGTNHYVWQDWRPFLDYGLNSSSGSVGTSGSTPYSFDWNIDGTLAIGSNVAGVKTLPSDFTPTTAKMYLRTPASSGSTVVNIQYSTDCTTWQSLFPDVNNRLTLSSGSCASRSTTSQPLHQGDLLKIDLDQVGVGASTLSVTLIGSETGGGNGGGLGDVLGPTGATDGDIALFDGSTGKVIKDSGKIFDIDGTLAANSNTRIATQKAVKTYVDALPIGGNVATDTIWDVKGDLAVGAGANTAVRLPVGSNGQVPIADSTQTAGIRWDAVAAAGGMSYATTIGVNATIADEHFGGVTSGTLAHTPVSPGSVFPDNGLTDDGFGHLYIMGYPGSYGSIDYATGAWSTTYNTIDGIFYTYNSISSFAINHGLGTRDLLVNVYDTSTYDEFIPQSIQLTTPNTVTIGFATPPTLNQYRVVIANATSGSTTSGSVTGGVILDNTNPVDVGAVAIAGSSGSASHGDHGHRGLTTLRANGNPYLYGAVQLANGTNVTLSQLGNVITISSLLGAGVAHQTVFTVEGTLTVATGTIRIYNKLGLSFTISQVFLSIDIPPTGSAIIVDVNKNGVTLFTNQAHRPQIAAGAHTGNTTNIDISALVDGDYFTVDVDQIGASVAGNDLTIHIIYS